MLKYFKSYLTSQCSSLTCLPVGRLLLFSLLLTITSCTLENRLARNYIKNKNNLKVLVLKPEYLFKFNRKEDTVLTNLNYSQQAKDSIALTKSSFLQYINDSIIIKNYYNAIVDELSAYGISVFTDSTAYKAYRSDSLFYIFDVTQLELDEDFLPFEDKAYIDTAWYVQSFQLNAVALDTWFETTEVNGQGKISKVLFSEHTASDIIKGSFQQNFLGTNVNYRYKREELQVDDIYSFAAYSGKINAEYIFDHIINELIREKMKSLNQPQPQHFYHYNRLHNYIVPQRSDNFTVIK